MSISSSACRRHRDSETVASCKKEAKPGHLAKNGESDLNAMGIASFKAREKMLALLEELLAVEEDYLSGKSGCSLDELDAYLDSVISNA